jgi:hypothetical protein
MLTLRVIRKTCCKMLSGFGKMEPGRGPVLLKKIIYSKFHNCLYLIAH